MTPALKHEEAVPQEIPPVCSVFSSPKLLIKPDSHSELLTNTRQRWQHYCVHGRWGRQRACSNPPSRSSRHSRNVSSTLSCRRSSSSWISGREGDDWPHLLGVPVSTSRLNLAHGALYGGTGRRVGLEPSTSSSNYHQRRAGDRIWHHVVVNHGFFTEAHSAALKDIWLGISGIFVSQLWLLRNETVHKQQKLTVEQVRVRVVETALQQLRAAAQHRRRSPGSRLLGICMMQGLDALESSPLPTPRPER